MSAQTILSFFHNPAFVFTHDGDLLGLNEHAKMLLSLPEKIDLKLNFWDIFTSIPLFATDEENAENSGLLQMLFKENTVIPLLTKTDVMIDCTCNGIMLHDTTPALLLHCTIPSEIILKNNKTRYIEPNEQLPIVNKLVGNLNTIVGLIHGYSELVEEELRYNSTVNDELSQILSVCFRAKKALSRLARYSGSFEYRPVTLQVSSIFTELEEAFSTIFSSDPNFIYECIETEHFVRVDSHFIEKISLVLLHALKENIHHLERLQCVAKMRTPSAKISNALCGKNVIVIDVYCVLSCPLKEIYDHLPFAIIGRLKRQMRKNGADLDVSLTEKNLLFHLEFPEVESITATTPKNEQLQRGNGEQIMVVDDEPLVAETTAKRLQRLGYTVLTYINPNDAILAYQQYKESIALVITDQMMPSLSGLELATLIKKQNDQVPILMITGYSSGVTRKECRERGVEYLAMKPLDEREFAKIVASALSGAA